MAQRVQVMLLCDLHDEDEVEGVETVAFGLDGTAYEVDACEEHATALRDAFARTSAWPGGPVGPLLRRPPGVRAPPPLPGRAVSARTSRRSASGPGQTVTRSASAAGCPVRSSRRTRWRTSSGSPRRLRAVRSCGYAVSATRTWVPREGARPARRCWSSAAPVRASPAEDGFGAVPHPDSSGRRQSRTPVDGPSAGPWTVPVRSGGGAAGLVCGW